jgi:hypothetical protein
MPALAPIADMAERDPNVRFVPIADIAAATPFEMKCDLYFMALRKSEPSELRRQEAYRPQSDCCPIAPSMGRAHGCHL